MGGVYCPFAATPGPLRLNLYAARFARPPMPETAPRPILGLFHQPTLDRIAMNVSQLLDPLLVGEHVEVVVAHLPELLSTPFEKLGGRTFQAAHGCGQLLKLWLGKEKMDVLGHDHIAEEKELMPLADAFENFFEGGSGVVVVEVREPMKATEGDEVVMAFNLVALQTTRHEAIVSLGIPYPTRRWVAHL